MKRRPLFICFLGLMAVCIICRAFNVPLWGTPKLFLCCEKGLLPYGSYEAAGTVYEKTQGGEASYLMLKGSEVLLTDESIAAGRLLVYLPSGISDADIKAGAYVCCKGEIQPFEGEVNPGTFDAAAYYRSAGCFMYMNADEITVIKEPLSGFSEGIFRFKEEMKTVFKTLMGEEEAAVMSSLVLADKSLLPKTLREAYEETGLSFLLTEYGLHIFLAGNLIYRLLIFLSSNKRLLSAAGAASGVWFCFFLAKGPPGVFKAAVMCTAMLVSKAFLLPYDAVSALSLSGVLLLIGFPESIFYQGFITSYSASMGIHALYPLMYGIYKKAYDKKQNVSKKRSKLKKRMVSSLLLRLSLFIAMLPSMLFYSFGLSFASFLVGPIFLTFSAFLYISGFLGGILGLFSMRVPSFVLFFPGLILMLENRTAKVLSSFSFLFLNTGRPYAWTIIIYEGSLVLFFILLKRNKRRLPAVILAFSLALLLFKIPGGFSITMLDVGQGLSMAVNIPESGFFLLDAGSSSIENVGEKRIIPFLKAVPVRRISCLFLSHSDADHINAAKEILESGIKTDSLAIPYICAGDPEMNSIALAAKENRVRVLYVGAGDEIKGNNSRIKVLLPEKNVLYGTDNENSLVLSVLYKNFSGLLPADLEGTGEKKITEAGQNYTFLAVPHHGSKNASSKEFLSVVRPKTAFISAGRNNVYGHPHAETLERLEAQHIEVYITAGKGMLTVSTDGRKRVRVKTAL